MSATTVITPTTPQAAADTRFKKGNLGGPGNPYARQCAQFRQALHEMVTKDDIQDLACDLLRMAKGGSLAAIKLLFAYVIGKPTPAPDPDRVELEDWKLLQEEVSHTQEQVEAAFHGQPASTWTGPARVAQDVNRTRIQADMLDQVGQHAEAAALRQEKLGRLDDPMTNWDAATAGAAAEPAPRRAYCAAGRPPMTNEVPEAAAADARPTTNGYREGPPTDGRPMTNAFSEAPSMTNDTFSVATRLREFLERASPEDRRLLRARLGLGSADAPARGGEIGAEA